jgi:hypothetical protein
MYEGTSGSDTRWNLFARELEDVLAARGVRLGQLDDRKDVMGAPLVHREKVRRLRRSLQTPKSFTVLNPEELERIGVAFQFTREERYGLYAALLATSVEVALMDRIDPYSALAAAEQILPVLRRAMDEPEPAEALRAVRGGGGRAMLDGDMRDTLDLDVRFEKALDALDRGTLALHLSGSADRYQDRIDYARQAWQKCEAAVRLFETATEREREDEGWQMWRTEAQEGSETAAAILAQFGISTGGPV